MSLIQAGLLILHLTCDPPSSSSSPNSAAWGPLLPGGALSLPLHPDSSALLQDALHLQRVGHVQCEFRVEREVLAVRVALVGKRKVEGKVVGGEMGRVMAGMVVGWEIEEAVEGMRLLQHDDNRQISQLYQSLPSPSPSAKDLRRIRHRSTRELAKALLEDRRIEGMRTRLHGYQTNSTLQMILQESSPPQFPDPTFITLLEAGTSAPYFLNLETWEARREVGYYELPRGGILCEEMGTGKTIISLALILATSSELSSPEDTLSLTPILTPVSVSSFPYPHPTTHRSFLSLPPPTHLPPLSSLCIHRFSTHPTPLTRAQLPTLPLPSALHATLTYNHPFYHLPTPAEASSLLPRRPTRGSGKPVKREIGKKMWLTGCTLVVVPYLLMRQWRGEIGRHFGVEEGERGLRVVEVGGKGKLPGLEEIVEADILLISDARFRLECKSIREAQDRNSIWESPLLSIRFKRMMIDEGHVAGSQNNDLMQLANRVSAERRWVISGTPTKNLLGAAAAVIPSEVGVEDTREGDAIGQEGDHENGVYKERWTDEAKEDVKHLGCMISSFLRQQPFHSESSFNKIVEKPLRSGVDGMPEPGAVKRIENILEAVMIRNRAEDVEREVPLPEHEEGGVGLDFGRFGRMTYNVLLALVTINVVTSQQTDVDYLLHSANVKHLRQVISNLNLASCHFVSNDIDLELASRNIELALGRIESKGYSSTDVDLLNQAMKHINEAKNDSYWSSLMSRVSIPMKVESTLPTQVLRAWSTLDSTGAAEATLLSCEQLLAIRSALVRTARDGGVRDDWQDVLAAKGRSSSWRVETLLEEKDELATSERSQNVAAKALKKSKQLVHSLVSEMNAESGLQEGPVSPASPRAQHQYQELPEAVSSIEVSFETLSSKINWILAQIRQCADDTFVIFSCDVAILGWLTETLEVLDVKSCYVGFGTTSREAREESLMLFQAGKIRVCLMDLSLAARGLNLVSANRIIFAEPPRATDIERQAIKRIHRIGQQRKTASHVLFVKETLEEQMMLRRKYSQSKGIEDGARDLIRNPRFVETQSIKRCQITCPLMGAPIPPPQEPTYLPDIIKVEESSPTPESYANPPIPVETCFQPTITVKFASSPSSRKRVSEGKQSERKRVRFAA